MSLVTTQAEMLALTAGDRRARSRIARSLASFARYRSEKVGQRCRWR